MISDSYESMPMNEPKREPALAALPGGVPGLSFHQLAYLRELERAGTVTEAAERMHISQPALSQALSQLERRLGVPLFERRGRRRVLTPAGHQVAGFASEVLGRVAELQSRLQAEREGQAGTLAVGMIDAASLYVLPSAIRRFQIEHPAVQLRLVVDSTNALLDRLREFDLDVAFVVGPVEDDALHSAVVRREPLYVYAPPGSNGVPEEAAWALYPEGRRTRALIDAGFAKRGLEPDVMLESDSPDVLRQMVALGFGWSVLPAAVAETDTPPLRRHDETPIAERSLLAVRRGTAPPDARAEVFLALAGSSAD